MHDTEMSPRRRASSSVVEYWSDVNDQKANERVTLYGVELFNGQQPGGRSNAAFPTAGNSQLNVPSITTNLHQTQSSIVCKGQQNMKKMNGEKATSRTHNRQLDDITVQTAGPVDWDRAEQI